MCRSIRPLFNFAPPVTEEEIAAASLQYVRKVAGMTAPSQANAAAFERAVAEITAITRRLVVEDLATNAPPRDREVEAEKARRRFQDRERGPRSATPGPELRG